MAASLLRIIDNAHTPLFIVLLFIITHFLIKAKYNLMN